MYLAMPVPDEVAAVFASDPSNGSRQRPQPIYERPEDNEDDVEGNLRFLAARRGVQL